MTEFNNASRDSQRWAENYNVENKRSAHTPTEITLPPTKNVWCRVEEEIPPRGVPIEMTGSSGYIAPHDKFLISGYYDAQYRPLSPWLDSTGTSLEEAGWKPTHWRLLRELP